MNEYERTNEFKSISYILCNESYKEITGKTDNNTK